MSPSVSRCTDRHGCWFCSHLRCRISANPGESESLIPSLRMVERPSEQPVFLQSAVAASNANRRRVLPGTERPAHTGPLVQQGLLRGLGGQALLGVSFIRSLNTCFHRNQFLSHLRLVWPMARPPAGLCSAHSSQGHTEMGFSRSCSVLWGRDGWLFIRENFAQ